MKTTKTIFTFLSALLFACQAQAIQISSAGDNWTVDWLVDSSTTSGLSSDLTATSSWLVSSFTSTEIILDISLSNTTVLTSLLTNADITSFGFGIDPNATASLLTAGGTFDMVGSGSGSQLTFPGGFKGIDICIFAQGCSGGSVNSALHAGATDSLTLLLTGDFSGGIANLLYFPLKFQTNGGSYEPAGCVNNDPSCTTTVPEPSILSLLAVGLIGMIAMRRKITA